MQRKLGFVLAGVGLLALVMAPLLRWYVYPRLAVVASEASETVAEGQGVTVLDPDAVAAGRSKVERRMDVREVRVTVPDVDDGTDEVAVWETSVTVSAASRDTAGSMALSRHRDRVAFDRSSGRGVAGHGQYHVAGSGKKQDVQHIGHYFKLPFDTEQRDYRLWDSATGAAHRLSFEGTGRVGGLDVYRFVQRITPTPVAELRVPGALFGRSGAVSAQRVYSTTRTLWVEPTTGEIVKEHRKRYEYLAHHGKRGPVIFQGAVVSTGDQVRADVRDAAADARTLTMVHTTGPVVALVAGVLLVAVGTGLVAHNTYTGRRAAGRGRPEESSPFVHVLDDDRGSRRGGIG